MIKKISVDLLRPGMYISDLNCDWIPHHNLSKEGRVPDEATIKEIRRRGITDVYIDTARGDGADADGLSQQEADQHNQKALNRAAEQRAENNARVTVAEELQRAQKLHSQAQNMVSNVLHDVKLGKSIDIEAFDQIADGMVDSVLRNHNALACLGRIRDKDNYLLEHSINLAVLMGVFAKSMGIERSIMQDAIVGAMLHDIGKVMIPDTILHKPGKLTDDEFKVMKSHVVFSRELLKKSPGISQMTINVAAQHHERIDGSGYPDGLHDCDLCREGKMCAIADVYDAITSDRVYHKGLTPTQGLKKLLEWSGDHLDPTLVKQFIRCVGLYPIGSLVLLESGKLGVVIETNESDQRLPVVRVMYNTKFRMPVTVHTIDLSRPGNQDRIVRAVDPDDYKLDIRKFLV
mgnify:CR=1 FL=1